VPRRKRKRPAAREPRRRGRPAATFSARSQILAGAADVFGEKGFAETSVQDVLHAAGVSRRTFYRLFSNKEELFDELAEAASLIMLQTMRGASTLGGSPAERLSRVIEVWLRAPQTAGPIFHVLQVEAAIPGSRQSERRRVIIDALVQMLAHGIQEEQSREVDILMLRGLIGAMEAISMHVENTFPGDEKALQRAKSAMMHIMTSALGNDATAPPSPT